MKLDGRSLRCTTLVLIATLSSPRISASVVMTSYDEVLTGFEGKRQKKRQKRQKIDRHHQDSNQGPSLVASDALTTELWCSRHPSRDRSTFSSDFVTHTSCESTQAGGTQPSLYPHTSRTNYDEVISNFRIAITRTS